MGIAESLGFVDGSLVGFSESLGFGHSSCSVEAHFCEFVLVVLRVLYLRGGISAGDGRDDIKVTPSSTLACRVLGVEVLHSLGEVAGGLSGRERSNLRSPAGGPSTDVGLEGLGDLSGDRVLGADFARLELSEDGLTGFLDLVITDVRHGA